MHVLCCLFLQVSFDYYTSCPCLHSLIRITSWVRWGIVAQRIRRFEELNPIQDARVPIPFVLQIHTLPNREAKVWLKSPRTWCTHGIVGWSDKFPALTGNTLTSVPSEDRKEGRKISLLSQIELLKNQNKARHWDLNLSFKNCTVILINCQTLVTSILSFALRVHFW